MDYKTNFPIFSFEGHRGARGLYPENSIGAMKVAIDHPKITTLEMDCHITKDKKVIVYHDDYLNPRFVTYTDGTELKGKDHKGLIYSYDWLDLSQFDLGLKGNENFPSQVKKSTAIPLLSTLIDKSEAYAKEKRKTPMYYNIETKTHQINDNKVHPDPQEFSDLILEIVFQKKIEMRTVIQSFDKRTIQYIDKAYPQIKTSYLIETKKLKPILKIIDDIGFIPFIISPNYKIVTQQFVQEAHSYGIKVIPWTVNSKEEIATLKALNVDGIISDYPNLF